MFGLIVGDIMVEWRHVSFDTTIEFSHAYTADIIKNTIFDNRIPYRIVLHLRVYLIKIILLYFVVMHSYIQFFLKFDINMTFDKGQVGLSVNIMARNMADSPHSCPMIDIFSNHMFISTFSGYHIPCSNSHFLKQSIMSCQLYLFCIHKH